MTDDAQLHDALELSDASSIAATSSYLPPEELVDSYEYTQEIRDADDIPLEDELVDSYEYAQTTSDISDDRPPSRKRCKMEHIGRDEASDTASAAEASRPSWPVSKIPVEIFEDIMSYITRAEVKTLRLVSREFETKVSAQYFKNVVVPFRSELYGTLSRDETGARQHPSSALFPNGLRIFESFGPHILRFALSLEIDENALAHPPLKPAQRVVTSFWGIYRWPHETYNRYSDLQSIEQTADETQGMKDALRCLSKVINLGLCCDAGLGFLVRPDPVARNATTQQRVFATQDWRRERFLAPEADRDDTVVTVTDFNGLNRPRRRDSTDSLQFKQTILEKMVADAGYSDGQADEAIRLLLDSENTQLADIDFDDRFAPSDSTDQAANNDGDANVQALRNLGGSRRRASNQGNREPPADPRCYPLIPANLTQSQRELLLELEWAHRAMIQSYVIAMIDNASVGCFNNLTTLTIAKIPSSHVHILYRDDFWRSFPNLTNVSLGVIADWRRISKPAPGCVDDDPVSPLEAVSKVHKLLNSYIGKQDRIESLHLEWICGGEFAPSFAQRNQYILPAPFLENPLDMVSLDGALLGPEKLLQLPHVKHLSLKNCWASPHVLFQSIRQMGLESLEKLELESVSLSGPPTTQHQFPLGQSQVQGQGGVNAQGIDAANTANMLSQTLTNAAAVHGGPSPPVPQLLPATLSTPNGDSPSPLPLSPAREPRCPDWWSWNGFLEHFSPSRNIRQVLGPQGDFAVVTQSSWEKKLRSAHRYLPSVDRLIVDEKRYSIKCLSFKSCGYVAIDSQHLKTRILLPTGASSLGSPVLTDAQNATQRLMQRCKDKLLGRVIPFMHQQQMFDLTEVFGMRTGWNGIYSQKTIQDAVADGIPSPGIGRFSGILERSQVDHCIGYSSGEASMDLFDVFDLELSS